MLIRLFYIDGFTFPADSEDSTPITRRATLKADQIDSIRDGDDVGNARTVIVRMTSGMEYRVLAAYDRTDFAWVSALTTGEMSDLTVNDGL